MKKIFVLIFLNVAILAQPLFENVEYQQMQHHDTFVNQTAYHNQIKQFDSFFCFFNSSRAINQASFIGNWKSNKKLNPLLTDNGQAQLYFYSRSFDLDSSINDIIHDYKLTDGNYVKKTLNLTSDHTVLTSLSFQIELLDEKFIDHTIFIQFYLEIAGQDDLARLINKQNNTLSISSSDQIPSNILIFRNYAKEHIQMNCNFEFQMSIVDTMSVDMSKRWGSNFQIQLNIAPNERCFLPDGVQFVFDNEHTPSLFDYRVIRFCMTVILLSMASITQITDQILRIDSDLLEINAISVLPILQITAWNFSTFAFLLILITRLPAENIQAVLYPPLILMFFNSVFMFKFTIKVLNKVVLRERSKSHYRFLITWLVMTYFVLMPQILTDDQLLLWVMGFLWLPQIFLNLIYRSQIRFYRMQFFIVQTMVWLVMPFEARSGGFLLEQNSEFSVFRLRPHPSIFLTLVSILATQISILAIQNIKFCQLTTVVRFFLRFPQQSLIRRYFFRRLRVWKERNISNIYYYFRQFKIREPDYASVPQSDQSLQVNKEDDCVICLSALKFQPNQNADLLAQVSDNESIANSELSVAQESNGYFLTPCNHPFHAECLRRWTLTKLECPTCRHQLPPINVLDGLNDDLAIEQAILRM